ncbi:cold shock domain-containing protein [Krasilnikovia sp. MM14-A1004]|uniref:cold shock domain-containing protein n=1 Tax=Krasilnikovia sp. MM14-A1004 TaxID=3373541 RepID=UPI00399CE742
MSVAGIVREWHQNEGWGVIESNDTPGGCWAHFSAAAVPGYVSFAAGQAVEVDWEQPGQDGFPYRAVRFWPVESEPFDKSAGQAPSGAYRSTLSLSFDEPERQ